MTGLDLVKLRTTVTVFACLTGEYGHIFCILLLACSLCTTTCVCVVRVCVCVRARACVRVCEFVRACVHVCMRACVRVCLIC